MESEYAPTIIVLPPHVGILEVQQVTLYIHQ